MLSTVLENALKNQKLPSVLLIEAQDISLIEKWVSTVFCEKKNNCGICESCVLIKHENHPDFHVVKPVEVNHAIKIEQIRALIDICYQTPSIGDKQFIWIQEADSMNLHAANALLKILEEPSLSTHFILSVRNKNLLPKTVLSRCWQFEANEQYSLDIIASLTQSAEKEQRLALGHQFEDWLKLLEDYLQKKIDLATLLKILEPYPLDDVLWFLQHTCVWFLTKRLVPITNYSTDELAYLCAIPVSWWWQFWDALIMYRKKCRTQMNLQSTVLLTRLLLILNGASF